MIKIKEVSTERERNDAYQIRQEVFVGEQGVSMDEEMDEHDDHAIHFVGYIDERPVLASRLRFVDEYGKLERICVVKDERGNHYGNKIIEEMEKAIKKHGYFKAKLNAQKYAEEFYKKLGYQTISDEFLDAGIPHFTMVKDLSI
uniref:GNAT family N-acetyltransferase n=1 Tax=uncultured Allobacillus sp. TaxID=1638025 RepID=UPI002594C3ED|nr:GNAT family N-acetyltransferase [uncultured Allobacillus sp.]